MEENNKIDVIMAIKTFYDRSSVKRIAGFALYFLTFATGPIPAN